MKKVILTLVALFAGFFCLSASSNTTNVEPKKENPVEQYYLKDDTKYEEDSIHEEAVETPFKELEYTCYYTCRYSQGVRAEDFKAFAENKFRDFMSTYLPAHGYFRYKYLDPRNKYEKITFKPGRVVFVTKVILE